MTSPLTCSAEDGMEVCIIYIYRNNAIQQIFEMNQIHIAYIWLTFNSGEKIQKKIDDEKYVDKSLQDIYTGSWLKTNGKTEQERNL